MEHALIPIVGMMIPMVLVPVILGIRHSKYLRELEHAERMRALELGRTLPQDESFWTTPKISVAIGAAVPLGALMFAWRATESVGYREEIWMMSGMVGIAAVISGAVLASRHVDQRARAEARIAQADHAAKPSFDADAYDVVSSRG